MDKQAFEDIMGNSRYSKNRKLGVLICSRRIPVSNVTFFDNYVELKVRAGESVDATHVAVSYSSIEAVFIDTDE